MVGDALPGVAANRQVCPTIPEISLRLRALNLLRQDPRFAALHVQMRVRFRIANELFFSRVPSKLPAEVPRNVPEMTDRGRTVADLDVRIRRLAGFDASPQ